MFVKKYFCYQKFVVFEIFLIERTMFRQVIENLSIFTNIDFFPIELIDKKKVKNMIFTTNILILSREIVMIFSI